MKIGTIWIRLGYMNTWQRTRNGKGRPGRHDTNYDRYEDTHKAAEEGGIQLQGRYKLPGYASRYAAPSLCNLYSYIHPRQCTIYKVLYTATIIHFSHIHQLLASPSGDLVWYSLRQ